MLQLDKRIRVRLLGIAVVILAILIVFNASLLQGYFQTGKIYLTHHLDAPHRNEQRLLEMGWNTPYLHEMPSYIEVAQTLPFDGIIFDAYSPRDASGMGWALWQFEMIPQSEFDAVAESVKGIQWGRLTDNFLRLTVYPAKLDWYDDYTPVLVNIEKWAALAHKLGFRGIMLDTEQYISHFGPVNHFNYGTRPYKHKYTLAQYSDQVYLRGQEVIRALNRGYAGITIIFTFALSKTREGWEHYSLMKPFIEGMINAADENTTFIDGYEQSYTYKNETEFIAAYDLITNTVANNHAGNPDEYQSICEAGFGLWPDSDCDEGGFYSKTCIFSPDEFEQSLELALRYSDKYVWVYSERINWYTGENVPTRWQEVISSFSQ